MSAGLRKRIEPFVAVRSKTVNHGDISYRALGILTFVLDKPDGWDIRAEQMCKGHRRKGREGRDAVRSALAELARAGYYRLERRQLLNGQFVMGTAASETPVESWAEQAAYFDGRAVPMVEQRNGSFLVKYPDGRLLPDDFPPPAALPEDDAETGFSGPGEEEETEPGKPGPGFPATGEAATGMPSPLKEAITQRGYTDSARPTDARQTDDSSAAESPSARVAGPAQPTPDTTEAARRQVPAGEEEPTAQQRAFGVARGWIAYRAGQNKPVVGGNPLHQLRSLIQPFIEAGYSDNEIKHALNGLGEGIPSKAQLDRALVRLRDGRSVATSSPGRYAPAADALRVNDHWDNVATGTGQPLSAGTVTTW